MCLGHFLWTVHKEDRPHGHWVSEIWQLRSSGTIQCILLERWPCPSGAWMEQLQRLRRAICHLPRFWHMDRDSNPSSRYHICIHISTRSGLPHCAWLELPVHPMWRWASIHLLTSWILQACLWLRGDANRKESVSWRQGQGGCLCQLWQVQCQCTLVTHQIWCLCIRSCIDVPLSLVVLTQSSFHNYRVVYLSFPFCCIPHFW